MAKRSPDRRKQRPATKRHYPRTARLNTLLHEIVADYLERIDDDRLGFLTVTGVEVDADLNKAQVYLSSLADESEDEQTLEALTDYRKPLQSQIARSARLRKTPEVVFAFDPAVREGARIETILSSLGMEPTPPDPGSTGPDSTDPDSTDPDSTGPGSTDPDEPRRSGVDVAATSDPDSNDPDEADRNGGGG